MPRLYLFTWFQVFIVTTTPGKFYLRRKSQNTISVGVTDIFKTSDRQIIMITWAKVKEIHCLNKAEADIWILHVLRGGSQIFSDTFGYDLNKT